MTERDVLASAQEARWRRWASFGIAVGVAAIAGCRTVKEERGSDGGATLAPATTGLTLELTPRPERKDILVELRVGGAAAAAVRELYVSQAWADTHGAEAIDAIDVRDERGEVVLDAPREGSRERVYTLDRAPVGELQARFTARPTGSRLGLRVEADRVTGVGYGFLLLPRLEEPVPTRVRWNLDALGPGAHGVSSLGEGDAEVDATSEKLARAVYMAGPVISARAGEQRIHTLGASALVPREILSWAGRARTVAEARLHRGEAEGGAEPLTIFLVGEPGLGRDHDGTYLGGSLGLWFDGTRSFDAGLRIALTHELSHRYLGGEMMVLDEEGEPSAWFTEGFTVHYARRLLFDAGMITAGEFAEDLNRIEEEALGARGHEREAYRRGSRYAALLDHRLRRSSKGVKSLDELLAGLRSRGEPQVKVDDFKAAVGEALGDEGVTELERLVLRREGEVDLPSSAFGPCLRRVREQRKLFDVGFDVASLASGMDVIRGVVRGSAASRAGLHDGLLVLQVRKLPKPEEGLSTEVDLTVTDHKGARRVRYRPWAIHAVYRWKARPCA
ncbi:hypothetical protein [Chondromyces crocatus]|uniref:Peptidase M61 catalytic domain-containing protein n=1 Tax=Chondromyces crocatus TaxID=52 RepID=A0A0K1EGS1_CHOCO|nr:hypothetical protein [Chondromyces crocatus]AKT40054.1 uncharacterized protein CMC5_042070 [Chondromyces crocatus]